MSTIHEQLKSTNLKDQDQDNKRSRKTSYSYETDQSSLNNSLYPSFNEIFSLKGDNEIFSLTHNSFLDEKEELLIQLSKRQRKISNYSDEDGLGYSSRDTILEWCNKVLSSIELSPFEKESIFHRFSTAFDFIMEKLYIIHKPINDSFELRKMIVTIFLVTYKLEGFSVGKIKINALVKAFLKNIKMNKEELSMQIIQKEIEILKILDYNQLILDDNIHQLSFLLLNVFKSKFLDNKISSTVSSNIEKGLMEINKLILYSDIILFGVLPLDKAAISFFSVLAFHKNQVEFSELINTFYNYLKNELKVLKLEEALFWTFCLDFAQKLNMCE